ncbi:MAG TPA: NAD(P)/FAD-dependent oxidoreductase [Planctomycetota bacterium]|nr:NAD(P)/FAD-dependent oxidoreductase [Planctomycetota bacterium]
MARDWLQGTKNEYDVVVIGSGLAALTAANMLAKNGHAVLLLEQYANYGGMATWFTRKGGHLFDISLHGFPIGMIKSCRKYWTQDIADSIVQLKHIRFDNPQFSLETTFDVVDFKKILKERFKVPDETVDNFFTTVRAMNFYDDQSMTTRQLFEKFFPGRTDVTRLLMEPIAYANGSTMDDPAITYGIVFSNFMSKGVYTFQGGTNELLKKMRTEMRKNNVDLRSNAQVEKILVENGQAVGVISNGKSIRAKAVLSNANLKRTILNLIDPQHLRKEYLEEARAVRLNNSSCQVYIGIRKGETIDHVGDLLFTSVLPRFDSEALCAKDVTSRTFSVYYPDIRPGSDRYAIVSSTNAHYKDWKDLSEEEYQHEKQKLIDETVTALEKYIPNVRSKIDHLEASTPRTFEYYTQHQEGASFGTKFEGLKVSMALQNEIRGLFHAGSVGIIMSGWLGAVNYGVIVGNNVDKYVREQRVVKS